MAKQDNWPKFTLRLPPDLHRHLSEVAGAKSLNAEIVDRLQSTIGPSLEQRVEAIDARLKVIEGSIEPDVETQR